MIGFISFLVAASFFFDVQTSNGLTVQTQRGEVVGSLVLPTVRRFTGIPYATAGRLEVPAPSPTRSTTFSATQFGDPCT
jgi:carboxylesterase type B